MWETKSKARTKIKELSSMAAAAVLGIGVGLIITIIFTKIGVWVVMTGLVMALAGALAARVIPGIFKYEPIACPFCRETSEVRLKIEEYTCDNCGRKLVANNIVAKKFKHLKLVVNNGSKAFGIPGPIDTGNIGPREKGNC
jgi:hypothetical protein